MGWEFGWNVNQENIPQRNHTISNDNPNYALAYQHSETNSYHNDQAIDGNLCCEKLTPNLRG